MQGREGKIEKYLDSEVKKIGGFTRKWTCPGHIGVPDRIVFYRGKIYFIEVKTKNGTLTERQHRELTLLNDAGFNAGVVFGLIGVDKFIRELMKC